MKAQEYYESKGYKTPADYYREIGWEDSGYVSPDLSSDELYPDYLREEAEESMANILSHQNQDSITIGFMTDLHYATTHNHEIRMKRMLNVYRDIASRVGVNALLLGGDLTNEGCKEYKAECFRELKKQFEGIDYLPANGNHDDGSIWDISYLKADKSTNHLTHSERYDLFFDHLADMGACVDETSRVLYYVWNDNKTKTRYICLDSGDIPEMMDEGKLRYSAQWIFAMSQKQVDWLINDALSFDEEGWSAVFWLHSMTPPKVIEEHCANAKEEWYLEHIHHIADAYKRGERLHKEYYHGDFALTVNADFSKGIRADIICFLAGDFHRDMMDHTEAGIPRIFTANSVTYRGSADRPERNDGDKTELLFDIITVDKQTRTLYVTRVGTGENRETTY